jgi:hypothetical protein
MPVHPAHIKRPAKLVPKTYTPPGAREYPVKSSDSWASLASDLKMDPWDLIRFNYPDLPADRQQAAKEVNWYLENYVGCTQTTDDRRNYKFSPPGKIWLPPGGGGVPSPDEAARKLVLSILRGPVMKRMTFGVGGVVIAAWHYEEVAQAIEAGKIVVKSNPKLGNSASYFHWAKPARIEISPTASAGLIIHECTHAIFDMRKLVTRVEQQEAFGYLSQHLYNHLVRGGSPAGRHVVSRDEKDPMSQASWQIIFDESTRLAGILAKKLWIPEDEARHLFSAIRFANFYKDRVGKVEALDGI